MSNAASRDAPPGSYVANHAAGTLAFRRIEDATDCRHELFPAVTLPQQLLLARRRQSIELGALVGLGDVPLGLDPPLPLEAMQRGIQGAGFDLQGLRRLGSDRLRDAEI